MANQCQLWLYGLILVLLQIEMNATSRIYDDGILLLMFDMPARNDLHACDAIYIPH